MTQERNDKYCGNHLVLEYFPVTFYYCPFCGEDLERTPEDGSEKTKFDKERRN